MQPLIEPHRRQFRDTLEEKMSSEGADAVLAALPASEADMPANKDFVRAEIGDLRNEMTAGFANADTKIAAATTEMRRWFIGTAIGLAGVVLAASSTTLPS